MIYHISTLHIISFSYNITQVSETVRERMEAAGKQSSSSSFTSDLFASKHSSSPNSQILSSIFFPPAIAKVGVGGGESRRLWENEKSKNGSVTQASTAKTKTAVLGEEEQKWSKEKSCSYLGVGDEEEEEEKVPPPFHYSSSIYYGGQEVYSQPQSSPTTVTFSKDVGEDDSGSASRGNWWQGSLYY